jgi:hypothetical protein
MLPASLKNKNNNIKWYAESSNMQEQLQPAPQPTPNQSSKHTCAEPHAAAATQTGEAECWQGAPVMLPVSD